jgi:hypothetical protein
VSVPNPEHTTILGPLDDGYKRPVRPCRFEPSLDLAAIEAQDVGAESPAAGQLPAAMPAENGVHGQAEVVRDLADGEEAIGHVFAGRPTLSLPGHSSYDPRTRIWLKGGDAAARRSARGRGSSATACFPNSLRACVEGQACASRRP